MTAAHDRGHHGSRGAWLAGTAIVLLALNMRTAVGSVGVVIDALSDDLSMSPTVAGGLTTLPVLCFAFFGAMSPRVVRLLGLDRTAAALLALVTAGLVARAVVDSAAAFLTLSVLSLAACAVGNVVLPALAKEHLPHRLPVISALFGAALMAGGALSSLTTVPIAQVWGGGAQDWRVGLAAWAALSLAALLPWIPLAVRAGHAGRIDRPRGPALAQLVRSPLAWACALCFGLQSAQAYAQFGWFPTILVDAGLARGEAGAMQGLLGAVGIPMTLLLPPLVARLEGTAVLPWTFAFLASAGWAGVLWAPLAAPWLWAILLGLGGCAFTWVLTMLGRRAATPAGTASLSAFAQSVGYTVAGFGPFGTGLLHDLTGSWTAPVLMLMLSALLIGVTGTFVDRDRTLEAELRPR